MLIECEPVQRRADEETLVARVLPIPTVLGSAAVVLLNLLLAEQQRGPVVLDARDLRQLTPVGAMLLAASLRHRSGKDTPPRIINLSSRLRAQLRRHPLLTQPDFGTPRPPMLRRSWRRMGDSEAAKFIGDDGRRPDNDADASDCNVTSV